MSSTNVYSFPEEFKKGFVTAESEKAKNEIMESFVLGIVCWIYLFAQMQSGKTDTYTLAACECVRIGLIDNIMIICGSPDLELKKDLIKKVNYFIHTTYNHYLEDVIKMNRDERDLLIEKISKNYQIIWGTELKKMNGINPTRTLFILEESHFGQSKNMMMDNFLKKVGICANGDRELLQRYQNLVISVSATGFSEISNMVHNNNHCKKIVRLKPGKKYVGIKQFLERGKIKGFKCSFKALEKACSNNYGRPGYGLVRMKNKDIKKAEEIAKMHGYKVLYFDSDNKRDDNTFISSLDELEKEPEEPTIIFLKDKCRMGKEVPKEHIVFCIETAKSSKTDTLLQGLIGRMCGYYFHDIDIFIHEKILESKELETYAEFAEGGQVIPCKAMNLKPGTKKKNNSKKGGNPIIPLKISAENLDISFTDNNRDILIRTVKGLCSNNYFSNQVINYNGHEQTAEIIEKINRLENNNFLIHNIENRNKSHRLCPKRMDETFNKKQAGGPGSSMNVRADGEQISLMYFNQDYPAFQIEKGCVFIYTTTKVSSPDTVEDIFAKMPKTSHKEIFCRKVDEII
jgi:hypothetical protein